MVDGGGGGEMCQYYSPIELQLSKLTSTTSSNTFTTIATATATSTNNYSTVSCHIPKFLSIKHCDLNMLNYVLFKCKNN